MFFELLRTKWCRIIMKFRQKPYFEPKTFKISPKVLIWSCPDLKSPDLDMSGPEKSWFGHVRTWKIVIWTCPDLKNRDLDMSGPEKSWFGHVWPVLTSKQRKYFFFWDFTPFHFLWPVLTSKQRKYFFFLRFYTFPFFISKFCLLYTSDAADD